MWAGIGLGMAGCTPNDAPGEPTGGPDRGQQEQLREMERETEGSRSSAGHRNGY
jgi:hypothetical protein